MDLLFEKRTAKMFKFTLISYIYSESPYHEEEVECRSEWSYPSNSRETTGYTVFKDLWEKGNFLTSGSKFGGDFLVYPGEFRMDCTYSGCYAAM